ncbi:MAG TPA: peptidoglycan-binding protein, partial [Gammaproteobacteria bacterium]|nr:peptidoglycan-binding protein [Gammaproteobacteria bacterium]
MNRNTLSLFVAAALFVSGATHAQIDATSTLPDAKPGECYAKVIFPAKYESRTEEVVVSEPSERIEVIPPKYEWVQDTVQVKDASFKLVPVPATYEKVTERIEVKPATTQWMLTTPNKQVKIAGASLVAYAKGAGLPADSAKPGQCYLEYYTPAVYRTEKERVVSVEASEKISVTPAKYEWVEEKVMVKEPSTRVVTVPAVYGTVTEKVLVSPATTKWKKGRGSKERLDNATGEIMCLVEIPAKYKTVTRRVVKTPATTRTIEIPAEYKVVKKRKLVTPAEEKREAIPAQYTEITKRVKVSDESVTWGLAGDPAPEGSKPTGNKLCLRETPAVYKTVTKRVLKTPSSTKKIEIPAVTKTIKVRKLISPASEKHIPIPA